MGAYSPAPDLVDAAMAARIREDVFAPTLHGMRTDDIEYRGCLYAGLMITDRGPLVLEYNARFGDPETQVVLPRLESDLFELLYDVATAQSANAPLRCEFSYKTCVGVVLASEGYPVVSNPLKGLPFPDEALPPETVAFWGGSTLSPSGIDAAGGRVLTLCGMGNSHAEARDRAYAACAAYGKLLRPGTRLCCRSDIGTRATVARH
jgi:phosphoribosylamine--glycine ligase